MTKISLGQQKLAKEKTVHYFTKANPVNYWVEQGEIFWLMTQDCYGGKLRSKRDLRTSIRSSDIDGATGPIGVKGIKKGACICVEILDIKLGTRGVMTLSPGLGALGNCITEVQTKIIKLKDDRAIFSPTLSIPVIPMLGVIGVAPARGKVSCAWQGNYGGNLDTKVIKKGSKVYLPVFVEAACLAIGDVHAAMGDGEISGTGIESAGKVCLRVTCAPTMHVKSPVIETRQAYYFLASKKSFQRAAKDAIQYAIEFIRQHNKLTFSEAYCFLSAGCDLQVSQIVNKYVTARVKVPKKFLQDMERTKQK